MVEIDPLTGLPKELGVWENIAKENQEIRLFTIKKKFGKVNTVVEGLDGKQIDIRDLGKKLKNTLACGGTAKEGKIELQGNHKHKVKKELIRLGYPENTIKLK
jgi:translation initiation factor 1